MKLRDPIVAVALHWQDRYGVVPGMNFAISGIGKRQSRRDGPLTPSPPKVGQSFALNTRR